MNYNTKSIGCWEKISQPFRFNPLTHDSLIETYDRQYEYGTIRLNGKQIRRKKSV